MVKKRINDINFNGKTNIILSNGIELHIRETIDSLNRMLDMDIEEEEIRLIKRLIKNRKGAKKHRQKKRNDVLNLEKEVNDLTIEVKELNDHVKELKEEHDRLSEELKFYRELVE